MDNVLKATCTAMAHTVLNETGVQSPEPTQGLLHALQMTETALAMLLAGCAR